MEPLNKQERTEAFLKVMALFLVSVILVAIPMYYAFKLPSKVVSVNTSEFENLKNELAELKLYDRQFLMKTDSALAIYNEFAQETDNFARDRMQLRYSAITNKMEDFTRTIRNDTIKPMLFNNVVFSFNKLFSNRNEIFTLQGKIEKAESEKEEAGGVVKEDKQTLHTRHYEIIKEALKNNGGNRRLAGKEVGLTEKLFSSIVKEYNL